MAAQLPNEVTQHINAYIPRDKNNMSPTSPLINDFIKTVNTLTAIPPELASLEISDINVSFSCKAFDVLSVLDEYGIRSDLSNLCRNLQPPPGDWEYYSWSPSDSESDE
jgi:hypothetical protein